MAASRNWCSPCQIKIQNIIQLYNYDNTRFLSGNEHWLYKTKNPKKLSELGRGGGEERENFSNLNPDINLCFSLDLINTASTISLKIHCPSHIRLVSEVLSIKTRRETFKPQPNNQRHNHIGKQWQAQTTSKQ